MYSTRPYVVAADVVDVVVVVKHRSDMHLIFLINF